MFNITTLYSDDVNVVFTACTAPDGPREIRTKINHIFMFGLCLLQLLTPINIFFLILFWRCVFNYVTSHLK